MQRQLELDRRQFIVRALGTGAGAWLALEAPQASAVEQLDAGQPLEPVALRVSAWLTLQTDGSILVQVHKAEMGAGRADRLAHAHCRGTGSADQPVTR
jgi:hypothetical protein